MEERTIDLEALGLKGGQARAVELQLDPSPPVLGGETYPIAGATVPTRLDVSRTTAGWALKLGAAPVITGPCARCLQAAELEISIEVREVDQRGASEGELSSPYVEDGILDPTAWLHDAIILELPEQVLCRPDCAGLCQICGISLNDVDPETHVHERPPDPRFAKLRELLPEEEPGKS